MDGGDTLEQATSAREARKRASDRSKAQYLHYQWLLASAI